MDFKDFVDSWASTTRHKVAVCKELPPCENTFQNEGYKTFPTNAKIVWYRIVQIVKCSLELYL